MRLLHIEAIVLRTHPLREADRLLVLLSRERGKLRAIAYGAAKATSKKRGAVQPFTHGRYLLAAGKELYTVRQAEEIASVSWLYGNLPRLAYAAYAAELTEAFLPEEQPNQAAFRLFLAFLKHLAGRVEPLALRLFEARLLAITGFWPRLTTCAACGAPPGVEPFFSARAGGVLCPVCGERDVQAVRCRSGTLKLLGVLGNWPFERLPSLRADRAVLDELKGILQAAVCYHLEDEPRSLRFLNRLGELAPDAPGDES